MLPVFQRAILALEKNHPAAACMDGAGINAG
jgi:hypothetical protein